MAAYSAMVVAFAIVHPEHHLLWMVVLGYILNITTTLALAADVDPYGFLRPWSGSYGSSENPASAGGVNSRPETYLSFWFSFIII